MAETELRDVWCYSSALNCVVCEMCRCGVEEGGFGSCVFEEKSARGDSGGM